MCEGVFLHSHVETAFGPQRGSNGGFLGTIQELVV